MRKVVFILISIVVWNACSEDDKPGVPDVSGVSFSTFLDERDSSEYRCITVDGQTWMAENLRYRHPWGTFAGCFSYREAQLKSTDFAPSMAGFATKVLAALNNGSLVDPGGLKSYCSLMLNMGLYSIEKCLAKYEVYPDVHAFLLEVIKELDIENRSVKAMEYLEKAEVENGGYKDRYGFLYSYEAAQAALPEGWVLPTDEDWKKLEKSLGMSAGEMDRLDSWRGVYEGMLLKEGEQGIGFNVRMGGGRLYGTVPYGTTFQNRGASAYFWSSTEIPMNDSTNMVMIRKFVHNRDEVFRGTSRTTGVAYSVRGVKK